MAYALKTGLIEEADIIWALNTVTLELGITEVTATREDVIAEADSIAFDETEASEDQKMNALGMVSDGTYLENVLAALDDYAVEHGLTGGDSVVYRDLFDTRLMGALTPRPSEVQARFASLYEESPKEATDWYYTFSRDTDYIRRYRVKKDVKWQTHTEYGDLDILSTKAKQYGFTMLLKNGQKLTCAGDEPLNENCFGYAEGSDWLMHEAFCLYSQRDQYDPYEKHHSTVREACELAAYLNVPNLILYHTEDDNIERRKALYTAEGRLYYKGNLYVPDDLECIELDKEE